MGTKKEPKKEPEIIYEVYNDEGLLVANDMDTILELLELNGYTVEEK